MAFSFGTPAAGGLFGSSTTGFGAAAATPQAPTSTGFSFGATPTASTAQPTAGFSFGTPAASTAQPSTGFSFGTPAASTAFGFGTPATSTAATSAPSFGFGSTLTAPAASTSFGFGATPAASTSFGFGTTPAISTSFGFGTTPATSTGFGFGTTPASTGSTFGFAAPASQPSAFSLGSGTGFGTTTAPTQGLSGFGLPQQQAQQPAAPSGDNVEALYGSVVYVSLYGDERDAVLAKWNLLQAAWGTGKGYYSGAAPPLTYSPDNALCRFKAVNYGLLPASKDEEGLVSLHINKPEANVKQNQATWVGGITSLLGGKMGVVVKVEEIKALTENSTEMTISVSEPSATGGVVKVSAQSLASFLWQQPGPKNTLSGQGVTLCLPKATPSSQQIKEYLETPPKGMDPRLWRQAVQENPDPEHLIPIPILGFAELQRHVQAQERDTKSQNAALDALAESVAALQRSASTTTAALAQQKRQHANLQHRLVKLLCRQEAVRKAGLTVQPHEENLKAQLEAIYQNLQAPQQIRGRLNELVSRVRLRQSWVNRSSERYSVPADVLQDIQQVLASQQSGLAELVDLIKEDMRDLDIMRENLVTRTR